MLAGMIAGTVPFETLTATGIVIVVVGAFGTVALAFERGSRPDAEAAERDAEAQLVALIGSVRDSALQNESAGRRLGAQIGETLGSVARISGDAAGATVLAEALADQVANGASAMEQIQAAVESLVRHVRNQDGLVDQSAAAVEQMSASIESVAAVAQSKAVAADRLSTLTRDGTQKIEVVERVIHGVTDSVQSVGSLTGIINQIAAQTNLLAMNAAIEAAHAGAYGRGFAVVAGEIRSLAESTAKNAADIRRTLKELTGRIGEAQRAGTDAADAFRSIETETQSVSQAFREITVSTEELAAGTTEVVTATTDLRQLSAESLNNAEEMRIAAQEVATILAGARDASTETTGAMQSIRASAAAVTTASGRITRLSVQSNQQLTAMLDLLASFGGLETTHERHAIRRLELANLVLEHMAWVGAIRERMDRVDSEADSVGRADIPPDSAITAWVRERAVDVVGDRAARDIGAHVDRLRAAADTVVAADRGENSRIERERRFAELLDLSRSFVEIVAGCQQDRTLEWTSALSVGVPEFDNQHRGLFDLINRLYEAMQAGESRAIIADVFDKLIAYTVSHFNAEETAFEQYGYPDAPEHVRAHRELVAQATELRTEFAAGRSMIAMDVADFLRDWVVNHIQGTDRRYTDFFAGTEFGAVDR